MTEAKAIEQYLLAYRGFVRAPAFCHVVVSRHHYRPKVLLGELDDNPSTSVTNAIEQVAMDVSERLLAGERDFDLYEYVPRGLPTGGPTFYRIEWKGGRPFRWPTWNPVDPEHDPWLSQVRIYVRSEGYTSESISGKRVDATSSESPFNDEATRR